MSFTPASPEKPASPKKVVRLRDAADRDWPMIRRWLAHPDVIRWWGPKATTEAEVMLAMGTVQGALCRIIEARLGEGEFEAVGYAHALDAGLVGDARAAALSPGTWQIDLFVASASHRGKGVGAQALLLMREELFSTTLALSAAAFVSVGNEKAVRAYEQAGFKWQSVARAAGRGADWVLIAERGGSRAV